MNTQNIAKRMIVWLLIVITLSTLTSCTTSKYENANELMAEGKYREAAQIYSDLGVYEDSAKMAIYAKAAAAGETGDYITCRNGFTNLGNFKDSQMRLTYYTAREYESQAATEFVSGDIVAASNHYTEALRNYATLPQYLDVDARDAACLQAMYELPAVLAADNNYEGAAAAMSDFVDYMKQERNSVDIYTDAPVWMQYYTACQHEVAGDYVLAAKEFASIDTFQDAALRSEAMYQSAYAAGEAALMDGNSFAAWELFSSMPEYRDSLERSKESRYYYGETLLNGGDYTRAKQIFASLGDYSDASTRYASYWYSKGESLLYADIPNYEEAKVAFAAAGDYSDASELAAQGCDYQKAKDLMTAKDYIGAYQLMVVLNGYKDVDMLLSTDENLLAAAEILHEEKIAPFKNVGQYVVFGSYEQDNNTQNGKENIEWLILDYDETADEVLLVSRYGLHSLPFHNTTVYPTWAESDIRAWLNNEFINAAFTAGEQDAIAETKLSTARTTLVEGGADTVDRIYLLSIEEYELYFASNAESKAAPTKYAVAMGAYQSDDCTVDDMGCCQWWLRSPSTDYFSASCVGIVGYLSGTYVHYDGLSIRPALKINLKALNFLN